MCAQYKKGLGAYILDHGGHKDACHIFIHFDSHVKYLQTTFIHPLNGYNHLFEEGMVGRVTLYNFFIIYSTVGINI